MKKLILIFGVFAIITVIITSLVQQASQEEFSDIQTTEQTEQTESEYIVKSLNGRIVVYMGDTLYQKTSTAVSTLPKSDQKRLLYGIAADTKEQVQQILDNYCS